MAATLITFHCKLFQMMPYVIKLKLKVRKIHQPAENRFSIARTTPVEEGAHCAPSPNLNRVDLKLSPIILQTLCKYLS